MSESPLAALCRRLGIAERYRDALGEIHTVGEETFRALLDAFDLPPDPVEAERRVAAQEREKSFGLPPVVVLVEGRRELSVKAPRDALGWSFAFETGERVSGGLAGLAVGEKALLPLPREMPEGYHRLSLEAGSARVEIPLIVAPSTCYLPEDSERRWGLLSQLYSLRSARNWGIGDFSDLGELARELGKSHAAVLGTNPLHALSLCEPQKRSPYWPSDRRWLNPFYIDVTAVPGFAEDGAAQALCEEEAHLRRLDEARASKLVDYASVALLKRPVLEALYRSFRARELGEGGSARGLRGGAFREFQRERGQALEDFAVFEALVERFGRGNGSFSWHLWPRAFRNPHTPEVRDFAEAQRERVEFYEFLQWESDRQLGLAAAAGEAAGLRLYRDLAVGSAPDGAEMWAAQDDFAMRAAIGAPPDALARNGQDWGVAPWNPLTLRQRAFAPFIALLRANMRHAGVLRIDHVMALARLFWVPKGNSAKTGSYVSYPFEELLAILALESRRARCTVIGEDLGTVPEGFRDRLHEAGILSFRVFVFERDGEGRFLSPASYPGLAAASAGTHDLATVKGFWLGRDIAWRRRLGLYPSEESADAEVAGRKRDRGLLLEALAAEGLVPRERFAEFLSADGEPVYSCELRDAILRFLARTPSRLLLLALEDLLEEEEQPNLPGTIDEHPNWRRRTGLTLEELFEKGEIGRIARLIGEVRGAGEGT